MEESINIESNNKGNITIQEIKEQILLSDWCKYLDIKHDQGQRFHCPFHAPDKNGSLVVYDRSGIAYDFHNNTSYDHFSLIMELKGISFIEALKEACKYLKIDYKKNNYSIEKLNEEVIQKKKIENKKKFIWSKYNKNFLKHKDFIQEKFYQIKGYYLDEKIYSELGYINNEKNSNWEHPLKDRLLIVWRDQFGVPIGLVGRKILKDNDNNSSKYKYYKITKDENFNKSKVCLFGSHKAFSSKNIVIVEGILDSLIGNLFIDNKNSMTILSTGGIVNANIIENIENLKMFPNVKNIIFVPDNDINGKIGFKQGFFDKYIKNNNQFPFITIEKLFNISCFVYNTPTDIDELCILNSIKNNQKFNLYEEIDKNKITIKNYINIESNINIQNDTPLNFSIYINQMKDINNYYNNIILNNNKNQNSNKNDNNDNYDDKNKEDENNNSNNNNDNNNNGNNSNNNNSNNNGIRKESIENMNNNNICINEFNKTDLLLPAVRNGNNNSNYFANMKNSSNYYNYNSYDYSNNINGISNISNNASDNITINGQEIVNQIYNKKTNEKIIIKNISCIPSLIDREKYIKMLSVVRKINIRTIKSEVEAIIKQNNDNNLKKEKDYQRIQGIKIFHPSYDVDENISLLGFAVKVFSEEKGIFEIDVHYIYNRHMNKIFKIEEDDNFNIKDINNKEKKYTLYKKQKVCPPIEKYWDENLIEPYLADSNFNSSIEFDDQDLLDTYNIIKKIFKDHIYFEKEIQYSIISSYVVLTYLHRCFDSIPFVFVYGPKGTGKSHLLSLLEALCFNAVKCKGITVASMGDTIDSYRSTMIIDQAEELSMSLQNQNISTIGLIADSYTVNGGKRRFLNKDSKNGNRMVQEVETYSPKIFASIRDIDDDIKDRCILITMTKSNKKLPKPNFNDPIFLNIRDRLYKIFLTKGSLLYSSLKKNRIYARTREEEIIAPISKIWELLSIDKDEQNEMKNYMIKNATFMQAEINEDEKTLFEILIYMSEKHYEDNIKISVKDIEKHLKEKINKPITTKWITSKLKQYGMISEIVKEKSSVNSIIGNKYYIINKDNVKQKYEKYFYNTVNITEVTEEDDDNNEENNYTTNIKNNDNTDNNKCVTTINTNNNNDEITNTNDEIIEVDEIF